MAITKSKIAAIPSSSVAAGTTRATGINSGSIDLTTKYGGDLMWQFNNGASAPSPAPMLTIQASADGTVWYDYANIGGDTAANSYNAGTIWIDQGIMYLRALAYGNGTNPVTVQVDISVITAV